MKNYLVKFDDNWADEMDIEGFNVFEAENEEALRDSFVDERVSFPAERSIGTNEELEYHSKEDYLNCLTIREITEEEYNTFQKFFPYGNGKFIYLDY